MYFIKNIKVGKSEISSSSRVFIIAEAGVNHNGSIKTAMELIDVAAEAGADAVKFQTYNAKDIILSSVEKAKYQKQTTNPSEKQIKMLEKLQIDKDFHIALIDHCKKKEIIFISTPYDEKSLALLIELQVPLVKIASTDTTNLLFLEKVAKTGLPVMLSTGMSYLSEIEKAFTNSLSKHKFNISPVVIQDIKSIIDLFGRVVIPGNRDNISDLAVRIGAQGVQYYNAAAEAGILPKIEVIQDSYGRSLTMSGPQGAAARSSTRAWLKLVELFSGISPRFIGNKIANNKKTITATISALGAGATLLKNYVFNNPKGDEDPAITNILNSISADAITSPTPPVNWYEQYELFHKQIREQPGNIDVRRNLINLMNSLIGVELRKKSLDKSFTTQGSKDRCLRPLGSKTMEQRYDLQKGVIGNNMYSVQKWSNNPSVRF